MWSDLLTPEGFMIAVIAIIIGIAWVLWMVRS